MFKYLSRHYRYYRRLFVYFVTVAHPTVWENVGSGRERQGAAWGGHGGGRIDALVRVVTNVHHLRCSMFLVILFMPILFTPPLNPPSLPCVFSVCHAGHDICPGNLPMLWLSLYTLTLHVLMLPSSPSTMAPPRGPSTKCVIVCVIICWRGEVGDGR